jgi:hypothetical protein
MSLYKVVWTIHGLFITVLVAEKWRDFHNKSVVLPSENSTKKERTKKKRGKGAYFVRDSFFPLHNFICFYFSYRNFPKKKKKLFFKKKVCEKFVFLLHKFSYFKLHISKNIIAFTFPNFPLMIS